MSINVRWSERIGYAQVYDKRSDNEYELELYEGNALLVALYADKDGSKHLVWFFADRYHASRCLGLTKGANGKRDNIFDSGYFLSLHFDHPEYSHYFYDIIKLFLKAFPNLEIRIN